MCFKTTYKNAFKISKMQELNFGCLLETKEKLPKRLDTLVDCFKETD
jgi:hypothetical protein